MLAVKIKKCQNLICQCRQILQTTHEMLIAAYSHFSLFWQIVSFFEKFAESFFLANHESANCLQQIETVRHFFWQKCFQNGVNPLPNLAI